MSKKFTNIEDFVREKLSFLDGAPSNDWANFERKLRRAVLLRRLKRATGVIGLLALLFAGQQYYQSYPSKLPSEIANSSKEIKLPSPTIFNSHYSASADAQNDRALSSPESAVKRKKAPKPSQDKTYLAATQSTDHKPMDSSEKSEDGPRLSSHGNTSVALAEKPEKPLVFEHQTAVENIDATGLAYVDNLLNDYQEPALNEKSIVPSDGQDFFTKSPKKEIYISPLQEKDPWTYSLNIYPNFAFRKFTIDPNKRARLHSDFIDAMVNSEASGLNLNLGFEVNKRIGLITYVNTGVEYIRNSYLAEFDFVNFRDANVDYSTGEITSYTMRRDPSRIVFSNQNSFHYLNFPLSISHQPWATENVRINLEVGFSLLYFLDAQGSTIDYRNLEVIALSQREYRKFMGSSSIKVGLQYYVNQKLNIGLEPTFMYFTNSIYTEEYPFEVIPYSMGLNVNLQLKL